MFASFIYAAKIVDIVQFVQIVGHIQWGKGYEPPTRCAAKHYDTSATLSDDQIRDLVRIGTSAPTSFHLQNWRFIAVRTPEEKARLRPIAWNQPAITEAAVTALRHGWRRGYGHV
ncbi:hypothetical protein FHX08_005543 [Rhizobium sp. BK529]|nr:hypothetical protein [Rhizobium sp. BK529]